MAINWRQRNHLTADCQYEPLSSAAVVQRTTSEELLAVPEASRKRGKHPLWIQLMTLTAHQGLCVYCGRTDADTLDHEQPFGDDGPDVWWNFVPACASCNRWKNGRSAREWKRDMELRHSFPKAFSGRTMKPEVFAGIVTRVEKTQREIRDHGRREWFRHHYDCRTNPKIKQDVLDWLEQCNRELKGYPHAPWTTPAQEGYSLNVCTRRICCGALQKDSRWTNVFLDDDEHRNLGAEPIKQVSMKATCLPSSFAHTCPLQECFLNL
ncbi:HNH endonuclease [Kitasatospora sp. NPDC008050]|uniref:HNH endonuclease n=1 Tax=Kitasatospora sp. NPDC008050 TaxID=3364021 RepID=UPI0036E62E0B